MSSKWTIKQTHEGKIITEAKFVGAYYSPWCDSLRSIVTVLSLQLWLPSPVSNFLFTFIREDLLILVGLDWVKKLRGRSDQRVGSSESIAIACTVQQSPLTGEERGVLVPAAVSTSNRRLRIYQLPTKWAGLLYCRAYSFISLPPNRNHSAFTNCVHPTFISSSYSLS